MMKVIVIIVNEEAMVHTQLLEGVSEEQVSALNDVVDDIGKETDHRPKSILLEE